MNLTTYIVTAAVLWAASLNGLLAAPKPPPDPRQVEERKLNGDWSKLSLEEKKWIISYCHAIREMPEQERRLINDRFDKFLRMTPQERIIMKQNYRKWQSMSPEQRQKAREEYVRHQKAYEAEWKKKHPTQPAPPLQFTVRSVSPDPAFYKDEFQLMILQLNLQGDQLKAFQLKVAERLKALDDWENGHKGRQQQDLKNKLQQARQANDPARTQRLEEQTNALDKEYWNLRIQQRAEVMSVLSLAQQKKWAAFVLFDKVHHRNLRGTKLTAAQLAQTRTICTDFADKLVKEDSIAQDPYLVAIDAIREDVANNVRANVLGLEPPRADLKNNAPSATP